MQTNAEQDASEVGQRVAFTPFQRTQIPEETFLAGELQRPQDWQRDARNLLGH